MVVYFISGHLDVTEEEFSKHYAPLIKKAIDNKDTFVVGDCRGADAMAQKYIKDHGGKAVVFHMFKSPRNNCGFPTKGGYKTDEERDAAMTRNSDCDIAWIRKGREKSGTAKNLKRRNANKSTRTEKKNT